MIEGLAMWNTGLCLAALTIVLGVLGIVSLDHRKSRAASFGLFLQGVILAFVAGASQFPHSADLKVGGATVSVLLIIQTLVMPSVFGSDSCEEDLRPQ